VKEVEMNIKTVLKVTFPYLLVWLAFMVVPALAGQPEVIVATPCGLILALAAGTGVVAIVGRRAGMRTTSITMMQLTLAEAILAGALIGAFQGLLFGVWTPLLLFKEEGGEVIDTVLMMALFVPAGIVAGGLLGAIFGALGRGIRAIGDARRRG